MGIQVQNISKKFGAYTALDQVDLQVPSGELVALLGPSGSGKTTLLRIIAGLETADAGSIHFDGEDATRRQVRDRQVGFVFQHYALFRHMTVFDNIAFGMTVKPRNERPGKAQIRERVHELLQLIQLDNMAARYPAQLSGGQRQRVALARALATEPKVLLLDEPFGALDAKVRQELRRWLRKLHDEIHVTSVFVTHDQEEALEVADRVVVMNQARIEQIGTPEEVYDRPATPFVFSFLGHVNLFHCRSGDSSQPGAIACPTGADGGGVGYVRPGDIRIRRSAAASDDIAAEVVFIQGAGALPRIELRRLDTGETVQAELPREHYRELGLKTGEKVYIQPTNVRVFEPDYQI
ncbi:sulfate ABC transporter ATP-binding protein [Desulfuromonas carbonis]|uniref:sulfate/molybdate ABC transporter ATP-binding protein n=1 Tax=Desulfuromonas sp. DDH964 TaxID=1823759 RepID=UPI00078D78CE|nr:sulfate ABC transporter ATP-binding protein [Desulfuromonas sp. DDH964]AMV70535.1 sulfate ABC transporter ATP-binding protein [Desulfuromonas sp. DDH964]